MPRERGGPYLLNGWDIAMTRRRTNVVRHPLSLALLGSLLAAWLYEGRRGAKA